MSPHQISWNLLIVDSPIYNRSSSIELSKLSRIMAMKRFKKMKDTTNMNIMHKNVALNLSPQP